MVMLVDELSEQKCTLEKWLTPSVKKKSPLKILDDRKAMVVINSLKYSWGNNSLGSNLFKVF